MSQIKLPIYRRLVRKLAYTSAPLLSDKTFLKWFYWACIGKKLNLSNPKSFNEKLQWLKLHDRRSEYTNMVDKYEAKNYVASIIGDEYINPTIAVYDNVNDIDFDKLPNQFVLKCTHDSGGIVICEDKSKLNVKKALNKLNDSLSHTFYNVTREYPYKNVTPRIIAEPYLVDESGWQLKDYKVFVFNGIPRFIEVDYDRYIGHKLNVYDTDWNFIDFYMTSPNDKNVEIKRPAQLEKMLEFAEKLATNIPFLRVDFYSIGDKLYFGELTFYPGCGFIDFHPQKYDLILGDMLNLNNI